MGKIHIIPAQNTCVSNRNKNSQTSDIGPTVPSCVGAHGV